MFKQMETAIFVVWLVPRTTPDNQIEHDSTDTRKGVDYNFCAIYLGLDIGGGFGGHREYCNTLVGGKGNYESLERTVGQSCPLKGED